ncbi:MAG: hypothetical protein GEV08_16240 [Acidimicrobiia bacterium]|nr:hypothetical protein [Acidimicrobiia bacterium]
MSEGVQSRRRQLLRPVNLVQAVFGLAAIRLGVAVLADHDLDHRLWAWMAPLFLVLLGALLLSALWPHRR